MGRGGAAVRITYSDGGQHQAFAALLKQGADLGDVSRPEALAFAGQEVARVPRDANDQPLDMVVTEHGFRRFGTI